MQERLDVFNYAFLEKVQGKELILVDFQLELVIIISFLQCKHYECEHKDIQLVIDS